MENTDRGKLSGLPVRKLSYVFGVLTVLFSVLLLFIPGRIGGAYQRMAEAETDYLEREDTVREFAAAAEYLSEQARFFVVTGDRAYLDNYREEAVVAKRREKTTASIKWKTEDGAVRSHMDAAMERSLALMSLDRQAFRLAAEGFGIPELPEELSALPEGSAGTAMPEAAETEETEPAEDTELSAAPEDTPLSEAAADAAPRPDQRETDGTAFPELNPAAEFAELDGPEKIEAARKLLFSDAYRQEEAAFAQSVNQCLAALRAEKDQRQADARRELHTLLAFEKALAWTLAGVVLLIVLAIVILIIEPLRKDVQYIKEEQPIPVKGAGELRFLAQTYNRIYAANQAIRKQLAYDAKHDKLTNVLNRRGYEQLLESANLRTCALLLVDVDKFKGINDTYGHKAGDKVLKKVADSLTEQFRAEDAICRIGGDEFAVLVTRVGMEYWPQIEEKIKRINETLQNPADDLPKASISVGCAFGNSWKTTGALDKDADLALYQVKENGRCGCAYYG